MTELKFLNSTGALKLESFKNTTTQNKQWPKHDVHFGHTLKETHDIKFEKPKQDVSHDVTFSLKPKKQPAPQPKVSTEPIKPHLETSTRVESIIDRNTKPRERQPEPELSPNLIKPKEITNLTNKLEHANGVIVETVVLKNPVLHIANPKLPKHDYFHGQNPFDDYTGKHK